MAYCYPHMCRMDHPEIGHFTDGEMCPVCQVKGVLARLREDLSLCAAGPFQEGEPPKRNRQYLIEVHDGEGLEYRVDFLYNDGHWGRGHERETVLRYAEINTEVK